MMNPDFFKGVDKYHEDINNLIIEFETGSALEKIQGALNRGDKTAMELYLNASINEILSESVIGNKQENKRFQELMKNDEFLSLLLSYAKEEFDYSPSHKEMIDGEKRIVINYFVREALKNDNNSKLIAIVNNTNTDVIRLLEEEVSRELAIVLALDAYSSFDMKENISRVHDRLVCTGESYTSQNVEYIFSKLFSTIQFRVIFNTIMTIDIWEDKLTKKEKERYDMIYNVILRILDVGFNSSDITLILKNHKMVCKDHYLKSRFDATNLDMFPHVKSAIMNMEMAGTPWA